MPPWYFFYRWFCWWSCIIHCILKYKICNSIGWKVVYAHVNDWKPTAFVLEVAPILFRCILAHDLKSVHDRQFASGFCSLFPCTSMPGIFIDKLIIVVFYQTVNNFFYVNKINSDWKHGSFLSECNLFFGWWHSIQLHSSAWFHMTMRLLRKNEIPRAHPYRPHVNDIA